MADKKLEIPMTECKSSCITAHGYHADTQTLALSFVGGRHYRYGDVPAETYAQLQSAKSIGKFFGKQINGKFKALP